MDLQTGFTESESRFGFVIRMHFFTESETRFSVNPNLDSVIEYAQRHVYFALLYIYINRHAQEQWKLLAVL